jgi:hypothetical protein
MVRLEMRGVLVRNNRNSRLRVVAVLCAGAVLALAGCTDAPQGTATTQGQQASADESAQTNTDRSAVMVGDRRLTDGIWSEANTYAADGSIVTETDPESRVRYFTFSPDGTVTGQDGPRDAGDTVVEMAGTWEAAPDGEDILITIALDSGTTYVLTIRDSELLDLGADTDTGETPSNYTVYKPLD